MAKARLLYFGLMFGFALNSYSQAFDIEKAKQALRDLGADIPGNSGRCAGCHDPNILKITEWANNALKTTSTCGLLENINSLSPGDRLAAARKKIDCLRVEPEDPTSPYSVDKLGLLTAG